MYRIKNVSSKAVATQINVYGNFAKSIQEKRICFKIFVCHQHLRIHRYILFRTVLIRMFHVTHLSFFLHYTVDESDFKFSSNDVLLGLSIESNQYKTSNDKYSDILNNKMGKKLGSYKEKYVNCVGEKFLALSPKTLSHCNLFNGSTSTWYIQYYAFYLVPARNEHLLRILILDQFQWT